MDTNYDVEMDTNYDVEMSGAMEPESDRSTTSGDNESIYTESLRSSLMQGVRENGRVYHKYQQGKYIVPEDEAERERLDFQHQVFYLTFHNKLIHAPITTDQLQHVLDIGTGTGAWAIDFADQYPTANVLGVDLSAMQPSFTPKNCKFEIDDLEEPWTYSQKFDLVHSRGMTGSMEDWPKLFGQAYNSMQPGGWIEMQDVSFPLSCDDESLPPTSALYQWSAMMTEASEKSGRSLRHPVVFKSMLENAGFVECREIIYKWPMNPWPKDKNMKELGKWVLVNILDGLQGFSIALFTRVLGKSLDEVEDFLVKVRKDLEDSKIHSYWKVHVVYGQKPLH